MREPWHYQIRITLAPDWAEALRDGTDAPELRPLAARLERHGAAAVSQLDAFEAYLAEAEAQGPDRFPLYRWTRATLDDPAKRRKHLATFALRLDGHEVYAREAADALEADLLPLVGDLLTQVTRHDTNPANNMPIPAEYR